MEEINDTDAKLVYERMRDTWRNEKEKKELEKAKRNWMYFLGWFLDIKPIKTKPLKPTEII